MTREVRIPWERPDWWDHAACAGQNVLHLFFPERGESPAKAKAICASCPVKAECVATALRHGDPGVWGGSPAQERKRLRGWTLGGKKAAS